MATKIEWTNETWNPVSGCTRDDEDCDNCYAVPMTHRLESIGQAKYAGLTVLNKKGDRHFNGQVRCHEDALGIPLRWKTPRMVFVNSMSDMFHRDVPFEFIHKVAAIVALCYQHTFQILTKRPERMAEYHVDLANRVREWDKGEGEAEEALITWLHDSDDVDERVQRSCAHWLNFWNARHMGWPLPNCWFGCSAGNQRTFDKRVPHLRQCPAAVRWLSLEPLIGPIDADLDGIDWVVVGGESGPGSRPCNVDWIRSIVQQCKVAGVKCFVKQFGSKPYSIADKIDHRGSKIKKPDGFYRFLKHAKGGVIEEWPADLRVREFPTPADAGEV
jgi:protein gp37